MRKLSLFLAIALISSFIACVPSHHIWHPDGWWHVLWFGFGGAFMWFIYIILVALVVYFIIKAAKSKIPEGSPRETPMDILKKRYAKGEITKKEFDKMKKDLES